MPPVNPFTKVAVAICVVGLLIVIAARTTREEVPDPVYHQDIYSDEAYRELNKLCAEAFRADYPGYSKWDIRNDGSTVRGMCRIYMSKTRLGNVNTKSYEPTETEFATTTVTFFLKDYSAEALLEHLAK